MKNAFGGILGLLGVLVVFLLGMYIFESQHTLQHYETFVGTSIHTRDIYQVTDWASHLTHLDTFKYEGDLMRYIDRGPEEGKVIVLLHGTPTNSRLWRKILPGLIENGYRVIAPDMVGFGASSMPTDTAELSPERQSERLIALLDHLDITEFALGGHDQGSLWVWETIVKNPQRISHLIIFNSIGDWAGFHPPGGFGSENMTTTFVSRAMGSKPLGRVFAYGAMLGGLKNKRHATTRMVDGYLFPLINGMSDTYHAFITDFAAVEEKLSYWQQQFVLLDIPTLVLWGSHDKILVGEEQIPVLQDLLDIEKENIHYLDAAHFVQEEVPGEIVSYMSDFMDQ